ncbi:hypothetical protein MesoLjLa_66180 (plasmid) [Mesorhizobium sp. L-2-11]|nr:hypothetical protein MesoLjLa_66180 [Mesorhizobium sp. L-2-11]
MSNTETIMSAQLIYDLVPLGSIVTYSDGTPRPPDRHRKKLAAWENRNSGGRLIRKQTEARVGNTTLPASITLHKGDYGSQGTIVLRVHQTFSVTSDLKFSVKERPAIGSVLVLDRAGDDAELVHLAANRTAAEEWLTRHGYPNAALQQLAADTVAADTAGGRTVA